MDIGIVEGRIIAVAPQLDEQGARRVLDLQGKLVCPGMIDLHCHVYEGVATEGVNENNASPDLVGVEAGVTTLVDAGSAGSDLFGGLAHYVVPRARTRILALLNISRAGQIVGPQMSQRSAVDLDSTIRIACENPALIRGIKLLMSGPVLDVFGLEAVRLAARAASEAGIPLMVHIGDLYDPPNSRAAGLTREMLDLLRTGDIVTHACTDRVGGLLDESGRVVPELLEAQSRGVLLDIGHGRTNFYFDTVRLLLDQGIVPDTISSDVTMGGRTYLVYSLTECMSKCLALGFSLEAVARMVTASPASALGLADTLGAIAVGREADLSVLEIVEGDWQFTDCALHTLRGHQAIVPVAAVRGGELITPGWGSHPWGWLPASA